MERYLRIISIVAVILTAGCSPQAEREAAAKSLRQATEPPGTKITILHVNDTHSHLEAEGPKDRHLEGTLGGIVKAASIVHPMKASDPNVLFIHAGDVFQEDVYFSPAGIAELGLLSQLGLDVMTVGNHEFDLTPAVLLEALSTVFPAGGSPVVTSNLDFRNTSLAGLDAFIQPNVIKVVDGVPVGFFGLVVQDPAEQFPAPLEDPPAIDTDYVGQARVQVASLQARGAEVIVLISHLGFDVDETIAAEVAGLDAIVGGHDHLLKKETVSGPGGKSVPIVHAGEFYKWVGKLTLTVQDHHVVFAEEEFIPVDADVERFAPFSDIVKDLQARANATFGEDLFHTPIAFTLADVAQDAEDGAPQRDSPVADLITDALRHQGKSDIALTSNGLLTEGLTHGLLVREDAFRIVGDGFDPVDPFGARLGFPLYRLQLPGYALEQALQAALSIGGDFFPQVSGMRIQFDSNDPRCFRATIHGEPLHSERIYSTTVNLGLKNGLEALLGMGVDGELLSATEYEAVRNWMADVRILLYLPQGRILDVSKL